MRSLRIIIIGIIISVFCVGQAYSDHKANHGNGNNGNNGNNGCEKANPNANACENNPNTNHPPSIGSVTITPDDPIYSSTPGEIIMTCSENGVMDLDGDFVQVSYLWTGVGLTFGTERTFDLVQFAFEDFLTCTVTPFDGTVFGESVSDSVFVTIGDGGI